MKKSLAITGRMTQCVQLTYRTPSKTVQHLLPKGLELVTRGPWAFWNVMACRVEHVRPTGLPEAIGLNYQQVSYRLLTRAMNHRAEVVEGFTFMHSDVDSTAANLLGNRLSDMRIHPAKLTLKPTDCGFEIEVSNTQAGKSDLMIKAANAPAQHLQDSCFPTIADTSAFARHTPDGLAVEEREGARLLKVTRVQRQGAWVQTPLRIEEAQLGYFDSIDQARHAKLEWACRVEPMGIGWQSGLIQKTLMQPIKQIALMRAVG